MISSLPGTGTIGSSVAPAHFFSNKNKIIISYLLNEGHCNAKCKHCYINRAKKGAKEKDLDVAYNEIRNLQSQGYQIILRGTEILLHPEFLPLFELVGQNYLQTNGLVIAQTPELLEDIAKHKIQFLIIPYPFDEEGLVNIDPEASKRAISIAAKLFSVTVSIIITKSAAHTLWRLREFCEFAFSLGAKAVKFIRLMPITSPLLNFSLNTKESMEVLSEIDNLKKTYDKNKLILQTPGCFGLFEFRRSLKQEKAGKDNSGIYDCPAGVKYFVIDTENNVYPCLYLMDERHKIGEFRDAKIEILNNKNVPAKIRCDECPAYYYWMTIKNSNY